MALPDKLLSETTHKAFEKCSVCGEDLQGQLYFLEKAYHRNLGDDQHSVIFEYAICEVCKRDMVQHVSKESMQRMQVFMMEHQAEVQGMMAHDMGLEQCTFTGKPLEETEEYHVVAVIRDGELQMTPVIFGDEVMRTYQELLSEETKGFFDDFYDKFIDIPPALAKILGKKVKPVLL
ncbi:hypothetical protein GO491_10975 [Flavobacteriaceae bacterium Ap0902]|nr:hypothetical protein [Flavobacteriaceae bacterium Ap0902]